jgi:aryl-alcohol dehydrogenase-like predicted oxidoreductase
MSEMLPLRRLGQSDLKVSAIGLGTWQFSKQNGFAGKYWEFLSDEEILKIIQTSLEGGINWIDTAELYGKGESEKAIARALKALGKKPGEVIIATKWWPMFRTASHLENSIGKRLEALGGYPIDLYQIHQPYSFSNMSDEMRAMGRLVKQGKIRYAGVSNFSASQMERAYEELSQYGIKLISNQVHYNLLNRKIESNGILRKAKELGISIIAYSPLAQGVLTGKFHDQPELLKKIGMRKYRPFFKKGNLLKSKALIDTLKSISLKYKVTAGQVALNWLINFSGETVVAIPGVSRLSQAQDNLGCLHFTLSHEEMRQIDTASLNYK